MTDSAKSVFDSVVVRIAARDVVTPIEDLRKATVELVGQIRGIDPTDEPDERIASMRANLEQYLAVAIPVVDHAGERGSQSLLAEISSLAIEVGESRGQPGDDPLLAVCLHDLIWILMAHSFIHDRTDIPADLAGVRIPSPYGEVALGVFDDLALRHNDLYGGDSFKMYDSLQSWIKTSAVRNLVPRWRGDRDLEVAIEEAELWAVLRFAAVRESDTWTPLGGTESRVLRRLRLRFQNPAQRSDLARLLDVREGEAAEALNVSYARLRDQNSWPMRGQLIPEEG